MRDYQFGYYNTTHEEGERLKKSVADKAKQLDRILLFFYRHPNQRFTPLEIQEFLAIESIRSVSSCLRTLVVRNRLIKSDDRVEERHGKMNHLWRLNPNPTPPIPEERCPTCGGKL